MFVSVAHFNLKPGFNETKSEICYINKQCISVVGRVVGRSGQVGSGQVGLVGLDQVGLVGLVGLCWIGSVGSDGGVGLGRGSGRVRCLLVCVLNIKNIACVTYSILFNHQDSVIIFPSYITLNSCLVNHESKTLV